MCIHLYHNYAGFASSYLSGYTVQSNIWERTSRKRNRVWNVAQLLKHLLWFQKWKHVPYGHKENKLSIEMFSRYRNKFKVFFTWTIATVVLWGFDVFLLTYLHKRNTNRRWHTDCISLFEEERLRWCFPLSDHFLTWETRACVCTYQVLHFGIRKFIGKKISVKWLRKSLHANLSGFRLSFQHCIGGVFSD